MVDLDSYEDPEENNWVLPSLPDPHSVPDNTSCFGPLYFWRGVPNPRQTRVSVAVTREITPPWRRGLGLSYRTSRARGATKAWAFGIWIRGKVPRILSESPLVRDWQQVVSDADKLKKYL
jgi:hypothetical protein